MACIECAHQYDFAPDRKMSRSAKAAKILCLSATMIVTAGVTHTARFGRV